ncbi:DUF5667 domain-containing protein [Candidatus Uhrbacteria bacterium]|nr:DUF5667 domain-containing protein [Candidatus Uhrbacteria bacterium]
MTKRDLLRKLHSVRTTERSIVPDAEFVLRTREKLLMQVRNTLPTRPVAMPKRAKLAMSHLIPQRLMNLVRAPALAMLSVMVTVFGGSILSVSASDRSLPGDFLYPIKIATEQTRLAFTSGKIDKLILKSEFVDRRVDEIKSLATNTDPEQPARMRQAAEVLKRDLNTVKNQLSDVKSEVTPETADAVKLVDKQSEQIVEDLKLVRNDAAEEVKVSLAEAEVAAVHAGVTAFEVLLEASNDPDSQWVVSESDIRESINKKVDSISATLSDSADKLRLVNASSTILPINTQATGTGDNLLLGMTSTTVGQLNAASSTLQQARVLLSENKLGEVSGKLLEAAKAVAEVEVATNNLVASSTHAVAPSTEIINTSSTTPLTGAATSTSSTSTTSPP